MPFLIRPSRRFPVCCAVTYQSGPFEGHGTVGISPSRAGASLAICPCDQENPSRSSSRSRMSNVSRCLKRWPGGREGRSLQLRMSWLNDTPTLGFSTM
jgi:hypothetical protein